MGLMIFTFFSLLIVSSAILAIAMRPTKSQKTVVRRLEQINAGSALEAEEAPAPIELLKDKGPVQFAWLELLLIRVGAFHGLNELIEQADSKSTPAKIVLNCLGFSVGGCIITFVFGLPLIIIAAATVMSSVVPLFFLRFQRSRRITAFEKALPDAIDMMARALRAGHSVGSAIEVVAEQAQKPVSTEFALVSRQQNLGLPFRSSLMNMSRRLDSQDLQFLITAMLVQKETGGNLTEILDRTTHVIRERIRIHGEVRVKSAQGRLTGWILSGLPVVMGVIINFVNPGFEKPLFYDPIGKMLLYCGSGMLVVGTFIVRKIVDIEV
jgi:tight adherence protein B